MQIGAGSYVTAHQYMQQKKALTPADALPATEADASSAVEPQQGIPVSQLKKLDTSQMKLVSIDDIPELRDQMARMWLDTQAHASRMATEVPDNAPQNTYATVTVNGKVVATLYNSGGAEMTNAAAGLVGDLPNSLGGPSLAQERAEYIAKALGGTIEKAPTAITQSEWTPRQSVTPSYTREQLDQAYQAMKAEAEKAVARRAAGYANSHGPSGAYTSVQV